MDVWTVLRVAARRWYIVVPILFLGLGFGTVFASNVAPVYAATSSAILVGPSLTAGREPGEVLEVNPYLSLGGSLYATTQVISVLMDSEPKRLDYAERGLETDYSINNDKPLGGQNAVLNVEVRGADPAAVTATANELIAIADVELTNLQSGSNVSAEPATRIRVVPLTVPETAIEQPSSGPRLVIVIGLLGLIVGIALALAVDGFLSWHRARNAAAGPQNSPPGLTGGTASGRRSVDPGSRPAPPNPSSINESTSHEEHPILTGEHAVPGPERQPAGRARR